MIIGVTNVIPFFGPFIGAIPATLLILIQNPIKPCGSCCSCWCCSSWTQHHRTQDPGNTTGLSSFWVLFAILLFGGLWGFAGMIVGVPLFAVIYDVIKKLVIHGLRRNEELDMLNTYHDNFGDPADDAPATARRPATYGKPVNPSLPRIRALPMRGIFIHIASQERIKEIDLMGIKIMLLGIAAILAGIALSISNIFAFAGGVAGLLLSIAGIFVRDNNRAEK